MESTNQSSHDTFLNNSSSHAKELVLYYPDKLGTTPASFRSRTVYRTGGMDFNALLVEDTWERFARLIQPAVLVRYEDTIRTRVAMNDDNNDNDDEKSQSSSSSSSNVLRSSLAPSPMREANLDSVHEVLSGHSLVELSSNININTTSGSSQKNYAFPVLNHMESERSLDKADNAEIPSTSSPTVCNYAWTKIDLTGSGEESIKSHGVGSSESDRIIGDRLEIVAVNNLHISGLTPELQSAILRAATRPVRILVKRHINTSVTTSPPPDPQESSPLSVPTKNAINSSSSSSEEPTTESANIFNNTSPATNITKNIGETNKAKWNMLEYDEDDDDQEKGFEDDDDDDVSIVPAPKSLLVVVGQRSEVTLDNEVITLTPASLESTQTVAALTVSSEQHSIASDQRISRSSPTSPAEDISYEQFLLKYNHALGKPLRKKVDLLIDAYRECD